MEWMRRILEVLREELIRFSNFEIWKEIEKNQGWLKASTLDACKNDNSFTEIRNSVPKAGFQENDKDFTF